MGGRHQQAQAERLPIVFDKKSPRKLDYQGLGKVGDSITLHGVLRNARKWADSRQEQWLVCSVRDEPFCGYWIRLAKPVLMLPPCDVEFADPPGKSIVGPYRMTGTLGVGWTDPKLTCSRDKYFQLADVKFEELRIPGNVSRSCAKAVREHWDRIGRATVGVGFPSTAEARNSSRLPLSEFVRQHEPILLRLSVDGRQALYCCAEGRKYLSWHGEALARVYCLIDLRKATPVRLYVETHTYPLE